MQRLLECQFAQWLGIVVVSLATAGTVAADEQFMPIPKNIETRNVPPIPMAMADRLGRYNESRSATLYGWHDDGLLIGTRFANTTQMHHVAQPLGMRRQMTFLSEPLAGVALPPGPNPTQAIISWDVGGSEFDQLFVYDLASGDSRMVSDGKSLYGSVQWSPDAKRFAYRTTERNGRNWDIHVQSLDGHIDKALETDDGFWLVLDWHPDGDKLLLLNYISVAASSVHEFDLATRRLSPLLGHDVEFAINGAAYDAQGDIYFVSNQGSEFLKLRHLDRASGEEKILSDDVSWDVSGFTLSQDKKRLAYAVNENGYSKVYAMSLPRHRPLKMAQLPEGLIGRMVFSPAGDQLAFVMTTPVAPSDVYVADINGRQVKRWTESEVGGLDQSTFVAPKLVHYPSFDGRKIPAFVYKPETPGPHPVVIYIHGGPEGQYRPGFSSLFQSYVNEMNVAVIAPNVRGSNGYGKAYLAMDNGYKREDSVKDIGGLLDWIDGQTDLRSDRGLSLGTLAGAGRGLRRLLWWVHGVGQHGSLR